LTRALRFHGANDLRLDNVALRAPAAGEVVVAVDACGVCGSDLRITDGTVRVGRIPITLGHEIAGTVRECRSPDWSPGDSVVVTASTSCGRCARCIEDRTNLCESKQLIGVDLDGGLAEALTVSAGSLIARPAGLDAGTAATAVDAGAGALHAVLRRGLVQPGTAVAVVGAGAVGTYAIQIAKLAGAAPIIAIDIDSGALERAAAAGADETHLVDDPAGVGRAVRLMTDGGVDVALEFAGTPSSVNMAITSLRPGGAAVAAGIGAGPITTVAPGRWSTQEYELRGAFGHLPGDAERVLAWLADGTIAPPPLVTVPLDDAAGAIVTLAAGDQRPRGRLVVRP